jgi:hypothetical protein
MLIELPTQGDVDRITDNFLSDLKTFTITDVVSKEIKPVICCVCDSIPTKAEWYSFVGLTDFVKLCRGSRLRKSDCLTSYCIELQNEYTAKESCLKEFILSPETYVNSKKEVLVCNECLSDLKRNWKRKDNRRRPPPESIISGYMIGNAPDVLSSLNSVELSLITKTATQCQSWIFFGGCHQHIKGWHTFFKGRSASNVANLIQMIESGWRGHILVVLCGAFTTEQKRLTLEKTSVDPCKVVEGWNWLKWNNYRYKDSEIPHVNDIPIPHVIDNER